MDKCSKTPYNPLANIARYSKDPKKLDWLSRIADQIWTYLLVGQFPQSLKALQDIRNNEARQLIIDKKFEHYQRTMLVQVTRTGAVPKVKHKSKL